MKTRILCTCLAAASFLLARPGPAPAAGPEIGQAPPALTFAEVLQAPEGAKANWDALKGKVVVLEFWATWCGPCVAEIPHLNELAAQFKDQPVQFIAITDEDTATVQTFLRKRPIQAWIGLDSERATFNAYAVAARPHTVLVDKQGRVAGLTNPGNLTPAVLKDLLAGTIVSPPRERTSKVEGGKLPDDTAAQKDDDTLVRLVIRRSTDSHSGMYSSHHPGRVTYMSFSLQSLVHYAYGGSPYDTEWRIDLPRDRYDVSIILPTDRAGRVPSVLQAMLRETFGVSAWRQSQSRDVLLLKVPPDSKPALTEAASAAMGSSSGEGAMSAAGITVTAFAGMLAGEFHCPVIDETGIQGRYDLDLKWDPNDLKTLAKALRDKYSLELTPATRDVPVLIVVGETSRPATPATQPAAADARLPAKPATSPVRVSD